MKRPPRNFALTVLALSLLSGCPASAADPLKVPDLVCDWDFHEPAGQDRVAQGPFPYHLHEQGGPIERVAGGPFSDYAVRLRAGQWFSIPRGEFPALGQSALYAVTEIHSQADIDRLAVSLQEVLS